MSQPQIIFLIEDDPVTSSLIQRSLEKSGQFKVVPFYNAEDALKATRNFFPAVLIIDHQLPGMTGIELFDKLKPAMPKTTLVIMESAVSDGSLVLKFIQKGVRNYVIKDNNLLKSIEEILEEELKGEG